MNTVSTKNKKGIEVDLKDLPFPDDIKWKACSIYAELLTTSLRKKNRMKAICYCLHQSYLDMGNPQDVIIIGRKLGLSDADADSAVTKFSAKLPSNSNHDMGFIDIPSLIKCYSAEDQLNFTKESVRDLIDFWNRLVAKESSLSNRSPRTLVAGISWTYIKKNNAESHTGIEAHAALFGLRPITVINISRLIVSIASDTYVKKKRSVVFPERREAT